MENMSRGDLPLANGAAPRHVVDGVDEGPSGGKGNTAGQDGRDLSEQHRDSFETRHKQRQAVTKS